ncbi:MAG: hypothetical protein LBE34_04230 [Flavobacteriaceae bacterium]|jgi:hypothetical protein|nr:hypothetical protein [Flavobacteriaceae bacterium]
MKKEIRYSGVLRVFLLFFMGLLLQFNNVTLAQNTTEKGAQISDESAPNALTPITFSILELSSKERGFLMPRMTTVERMRIPTANLSGGMVIFNTTLDCVEFYNASRQQWMNICGGNDPAVYTIPELKCGTAKASGTYTAGVLLDERKNIITIEVSVSSPGSFDIEAIAYDDTTQLNGYTFSAHGTFPTEGSFVIVLRGKGTPKKGYAAGAGKDKIKFFLNKKLVTCEISNDVAKDFEPLVANLLCTDVTNKINVEGTYKEKVPLTAANRITVPVKVTKSGRGKVYGKVEKTTTQTENVLYESDVTDFVVTPSNGVQWVVLKPAVNTGKPTTGGNMKVDLKIVSKGKNEYDPFVPADPKDISTCSFNINVESDGPKYNMGSAVLKSNFVTTIKTKDKSGSSVTVGTPYITPKTDMAANGGNDFKIELTIEPIATGHYKITTKNQNNGIYFEGEGEISQSDVNAKIKTVVLKAYGVSETDLPYAYGRFDFVGNNSDPKYINTSTIFVDFVYRPMQMYSIGGKTGQSWHPGGFNGPASNWFAGPRVIRNYKHFSWDGVVRIAGLSIIGISDFVQTGPGIDTTGDAVGSTSTMSTKLGVADMVFIGGNDGVNLKKDNGQLFLLADYVLNKKGALVYGEGDAATMNTFMTYMVGSSLSASNAGTEGPFTTTSFIGNEGKLILGQDGKYFSTGDAFTGLYNKYLAGHNSATTIQFSGLGSNYASLVGGATTGTSFAVVHRNLGLVAVGSSLFMGGYVDGISSATSYPLNASKTGDPLIKKFGSKGDVYNSWFLLNLVHWAIDYAQENQPNDFKP